MEKSSYGTPILGPLSSAPINTDCMLDPTILLCFKQDSDHTTKAAQTNIRIARERDLILRTGADGSVGADCRHTLNC